jgi:LPS-assembly protein
VPLPRLRPLPLAVALLLAVPAARGADTPDWALCRAPEALPSQRPSPAPEGVDRATAEMAVLADRMDMANPKETVFSGNVELSRADQWLRSDELRYQHDSGQWASPGPLRYEDRAVRMTAARGEGNAEAEAEAEADAAATALTDVQYQLNRTAGGNGRAATVSQAGDKTTLADATYSTCPPGQRQWEFRAGTISLDEAAKQGRATNATLRIGKVPVLWLPFVVFPTTEERRTGLLAPTVGYDDRNGFDWRQPYYLNLAPNYDATLAPRWMQERGLMLGGEFRYLGVASGGTVQATWLPDDDLANRDRSFLSWQHFSALSPTWYADVRLQDVSDPRYFTDFGDSLQSTSLAFLDSAASLVGRGRFWSTRLSVARWDIANPALPPGSEPYQRMPELRLALRQPLGSWFEAGVDSELVRFEHPDLPGATRLDLQPWLRGWWGGSAWYARPELRWRRTEYRLGGGFTGERSRGRSLPIASLDVGAAFEREIRWFGRDVLQTLEPRLFYLRVPYREQADLPLLDSQPLGFSWPGLVRTNRYAGADRQSDANQVTVAVTSRLLDREDGRERVSASLGRILYLDPPRLRPPQDGDSDDGSAWVGEVDWRVSDRWSLSVAQQWDPGESRTALSALRSQWRFSDQGVANLAYRYRENAVEQADASFALPVAQRWRLVGRWAWSLRDRRTLEALGGVEWRDCCMAVRVLGREYIRDLNAERNRGIYLEIELNGLGSFGRDTARLLHDAILGYSP